MTIGLQAVSDLQVVMSQDSLERTDTQRHFVIQNSEALLLKVAHGRAGLRSDYNVQIDPAIAGLGVRIILAS